MVNNQIKKQSFITNLIKKKVDIRAQMRSRMLADQEKLLTKDNVETDVLIYRDKFKERLLINKQLINEYQNAIKEFEK